MKRRILGLACVALAMACPPHDDDYTPQIQVAPGAAGRMNLFPGKGQQKAAPDAGAAGPSARVHVMTSGDLLGGPNAIGRPGDVMLENDEVVFVIDQIASAAGFAESGGNLVDAADAHERKDELGQMFTYFGTFPRQGVYETLETGTAGTNAWVLAKGHELYEKKLAVSTRYELQGSDRAMLVTTTLTNEGDVVIGGLTPGDAIQWAGAEKFSPDRGKSFKGPSSGAFLGGVGRFVSYAIASTSGDIDAMSGPSWSDTIQGRSITVAPGKSMQYARIFLVGARADTAGVVSELSRAAGETVGSVSIALTDAAGAPVRVPEGAAVEISNAAGKTVMDVHALHAADTLAAELPPGHYGLAYVGGGGRTGTGKGAVDVVGEKVAPVKLAVGESGKMTLQCSEGNHVACPCKATFEGVGTTRTPEFGPPHASGAARNQFTTHDGVIAVDLAPGRYRVTLSRGPEFALNQFEKDVAPGAVTDGCAGDKCVLARVVDTTGYVASDFHQHTMLGVDAPTATRDRVISNAAEGVEVAVASEHNVIADLEPIVKDLGLSSRLVSIAGNELTSDASRKPWGHANAWPLTYDATKLKGGAQVVRDKTAHQLFEELRQSTVPFVLQINHPRAGMIGYFDLYGFDRGTGVGTDPGYDPGFDALEVWNGRNARARENTTADFIALLRTSHPVTATANTDTHGVVMQEPGYPRTYVRVSDDAHLDGWDAARTTDLVKGVKERRDVVMTNGPFLRVTANGAGIGGVAKAAGKSVTVSIEVVCAPWVKVDKVRVRSARNGAATVEQAVTLAPNGKGASVAKAQIRMAAEKDDAIFVEAIGHELMGPVLGRDSTTDDADIAPYAMTGAIWVDADGDGKSLGR